MIGKLALAMAAVVALGSLGASSASPQILTPPPPAASRILVASTALPPYAPVIDPAKFSDKITNPYFPLQPGTTLIYEGKRDDSPRRDEVTITKETRIIMGVRCVVVRDISTSNTELLEKTSDWYAQDPEGNVWYFGEDTAEYKN